MYQKPLGLLAKQVFVIEKRCSAIIMICVCCFLSLSEEGDVLQRIRQFLAFEQSDVIVYNCHFIWNILLIVWLSSVLIQDKHVILALVRLGKINNSKFIYEKIVCFLVLYTNCFLYSIKFWLNMLGSNRGCLCVCVCDLYSLNGWFNFDETF